jgi:hypothetical protein
MCFVLEKKSHEKTIDWKGFTTKGFKMLKVEVFQLDGPTRKLK